MEGFRNLERRIPMTALGRFGSSRASNPLRWRTCHNLGLQGTVHMFSFICSGGSAFLGFR